LNRWQDAAAINVADKTKYMVSIVKDWLRRQNPKFDFLYRSFGSRGFRLLDIGTGNHSATKTVSLFPKCEYYGLDISRDYNNDPADFAIMKDFYEMDLTKLDFSALPDSYFDAILVVHVIEHLHNGDEVLKGLVKKLRPGGSMYVEYPGARSKRLPSMKGTLNFHDDASHVRLYSVGELKKVFVENDCTIVSAGTRRSWFYTAVTPLRIPLRWVRGKAVTGNVFWDLLGFAEYVWIKRKG
jgi:SAM-dependent methyltransferase